MLSTKLKEAAGNSADATLYVNDVFSTYLYTGNGSTQTITNGIDLAGKGGMVWTKSRSLGTSAEGNRLVDTLNSGRSFGWTNISESTSGRFDGTVASFSSTGYFLNGTTYGNAGYNTNAATYASWTFREAAKFFDVVTYTGTGSARTIAHSLGVAPGMVIVKRTDTTGNWQVYSNGLTSAAYSMQLNSGAAQASAPTVWNSTAPTSSVFSVGTDSTVNASGGTYVAYLYAHDTSSTGIIQCGSFTTDGSGNATVNLGWEPQFYLGRDALTVDGWAIKDIMRGMPVGTTSQDLYANSSGSESVGQQCSPLATGFKYVGGASATYIYMAIRRPNKPPTTGTQVYSPVLGSTNISAPDYLWFTTPFPVDLVIQANRTTNANKNWWDRLRGSGKVLASNLTDAEGSGVFEFDVQNGVQVSSAYAGSNVSYEIGWNFKRAPGFFDVVCYTGTGSATTQAHNLGVVPELMIVKPRNAVDNWCVYTPAIGITYVAYLNWVDAKYGPYSPGLWNNTTPTASVFSLSGSGWGVNNSAVTYVAYLFATLAGISKVGSYTGNGTSQNIECGFSAGARFILIKCTSTTGNWYVWDTVRGITAGLDYYLRLNTINKEFSDDDIYPYAGGFGVNEAGESVNTTSQTYIFFAVS